MEKSPKSTLRFELIQSAISKGDWQIKNNWTGEAALLNLKSLAKIKRKFKRNICDDRKFFFRFLSLSDEAEIKKMLPTARFSNNL